MRSGNIELDRPIRAALDRPRKKLTTRKIALPIAIDEDAPLNGQFQIGLRALDMHLLAPDQPVHQSLLLHRKLLPASNRVRVIQETDIENKLLKIAQRHLRVLRIPTRRIERRRPAELLLLLPSLHNVSQLHKKI